MNTRSVSGDLDRHTLVLVDWRVQFPAYQGNPYFVAGRKEAFFS